MRTKTYILIAFLLTTVPAARAAAPSEASLDASERVFAVMAMASLAGLNPWLDYGDPPLPVRELWAHLRLLPEEAVAPVREFIGQHRQGSRRSDLGRYLSLALMLSEPPDFDWLVSPRDLPPDVREIRDFRDVLRRFYAEANLRAVWYRYLKAYEDQIARWQPSVSQTLLRTRAYLRLLGESPLGQRYVIFLEWLVPPGLTSARNYADNYYLVVNPVQDDLLSAVRHQYLHFLIDPLAAKYASLIGEKADLLEVARRAPRLPETYRTDFLLLVVECLTQAIELRTDKLADAEAGRRLDEFEQQGFILSRYFLGALKQFEQADPSFRFYFPELLAGLNVGRERARLEHVSFAPPAAPEPDSEPVLPPVGPEPLLAEAERQLRRGNQETARMIFERVLSDYNEEEPRALYGLAVIASLQEDADRAREYFERTARVARDPAVLGWTHVYLGRLYDLAGEREQALAHYQAALALAGAPQRIQQAARRGLETPYRSPLGETQP